MSLSWARSCSMHTRSMRTCTHMLLPFQPPRRDPGIVPLCCFQTASTGGIHFLACQAIQRRSCRYQVCEHDWTAWSAALGKAGDGTPSAILPGFQASMNDCVASREQIETDARYSLPYYHGTSAV